MEPIARLLFLGAPRIVSGGTPVQTLESRKALALLGYLAARGAAIPRSQLVALFWPELSDERGRANLRGVLHTLTTVLPGCLATDRHTVQLLGTPDCWTDTAAFEAMVAQGTISALAAAVDLYRGPFLDGLYLDDCPDAESWLTQERERWHERAAHALAELTARYRARREWEWGLRSVDRLLALDPWRETAHQEKMRLLTLSGQRDSALAHYETCRRILADELGSDPSDETTALYEQIRDGELSPAGAAASQPFQVPLPATPLLGRAAELARISQLLAQPTCRLLTLLGPGGVGKTRLALDVALEQQSRFGDGVCVIELAPLHDPALVTTTLAQTLGVPDGDGRAPNERLRAWLRTKHLLLVLDNFEHVLPAAPLVRELLAGSPQLTVLVTSRSPLHVQGEQEFRVGPLALPDPSGLRAPGVDRAALVAQSAAAVLFVERARHIDARFALTDDNAADIAELCVRLDGLPLAIELAAARTKVFSPAALLARLERRLPLLTSYMRDRLPHQHTMRSTIAWSCQLLTAHEHALFTRLSVFVGGWTLELAEAVVGAAGTLELDVVDGIAALVDHSLVRQQRDERGEARFGMLETIREYAWEQLDASAAVHAIRRRHAATFAEFAEDARHLLRGARHREGLERLETEHDNLRAALAFGLSQHEAAVALRLGGALWPFWHIRGYFAEGYGWLTTIRAATDSAATDRYLEIINGAATLAAAQGSEADAKTLTEELLALAEVAGDRRWVGIALLNRAANQTNSRYVRAVSLLENSLALYQRMGNETARVPALLHLGRLLLRSGSFHAALERYQTALQVAASLTHEIMLANCFDALAETAVLSGVDYDAIQLYGVAEALRTRLGAPREPYAQELVEHSVATLRTQLDAARFDDAWATGQAMRPGAAVAYALALTISPA